MLILALETSTVCGSVAALVGDEVIAELDLEQQQRTAQSLAPGIARLLRDVNRRPNEVQLVAVSHGPGSFTGLRLGVTTAKAFAYAVGAEILGVNTLDAVAHQVPGDEMSICAALDAHRRQLFTKSIRRSPSGKHETTRSTCVVGIDQWLGELRSDLAVTGPGLKKVAANLPTEVSIVDERHWAPRASTVGKLAYADYQSGAHADVWQLVPHYYRASAAEENAKR